MKKGIKFSISIRLGFILLSLFFLSIFSYLSINNVHKSAKDIIIAENLHATAINGGKAHFKWAERLISSISFNTNFEGELDYKSCELGKWLYSGNTENEKISSIIDKIIPIHEKIHSEAKIILDDKMLMKDKKQHYAQNIYPQIQSLTMLLDEIMDISKSDIEIAIDNAEKTIKFSLITIVLASLISLILFITIIKYISSQIINPILKIKESCEELQNGNLNTEITINSSNEIGILAKSFNESTKEMSTYINEIGRLTQLFSKGDFSQKCNTNFKGDFKKIGEYLNNMQQKLCEVFAEINLSAEAVNSASLQVANFSQNFSQSFSQDSIKQTENAENISNSLNELLEQVKNDAKNANDADQFANQLCDDMANSANKMKELITAMENINNKSQEINKITTTIESIAFQTNILALNAAVEAARAGTSGKGFAVVADEVRNLANKTSEASQNICELINLSMETVNNGVNIVNEMSEIIEDTKNNAYTTLNSIDIISNSVNDQVEEINEINRNISQILNVIHNNSSYAQESAATSEELSSMADHMKFLVNKFKM